MADVTQPPPEQPDPYRPGPPQDPFLAEEPDTGSSDAAGRDDDTLGPADQPEPGSAPGAGAPPGEHEPTPGGYEPTPGGYEPAPGGYEPAPGGSGIRPGAADPRAARAYPTDTPSGGYPAPHPPVGYGFPPGAPDTTGQSGFGAPTHGGYPPPSYPPQPSGYPTSGFPTPGYPLPAQQPSGVVVTTIGEIQVTATTIRTPAGDMPLRGSQWTVNDQWMRREKIPTWAIVAAIAGFCVLTVFSLLFLLARESVYEGVVQVQVSNGPRQYVARIPVTDQMQVQHIHNQVNYARSLGAV